MSGRQGCHRAGRLAPLASVLALSVALAATASAAPTQSGTAATSPPNAKAAPSGTGKSGLIEFGNSKEPIRIDSDRLDVFDKESRAVFTGNVVAVQGERTMRCTVMRVYYEPRSGGGAETGGSGLMSGNGASGGLGGNSSIKRIECAGPVTMASKTQTATSDRAEYDRGANKVYLIGNAALAEGANVTRGERVAYDLTTGVANVEGGRVRALIVPKNKDGEDKKDDKVAAPSGRPKAR